MYAYDGWCDEPAFCEPGTDSADCEGYCKWTNDGNCDEPDYSNLCEYGTDVRDCEGKPRNYGLNSRFAQESIRRNFELSSASGGSGEGSGTWGGSGGFRSKWGIRRQ